MQRNSLSSSRLGLSRDVEKLQGHQDRIMEAFGAEFWYKGLCVAFVTLQARELMLPHSVARRLVNQTRPGSVVTGIAST